MNQDLIFGDIADSLVIFNEITFNRLWELGPDAYLLYSFYYKAAKFQKNRNPWATNEFAMKGLKWGKDRFKKAKGLLRDNGFIKDTKIKGKDGKIIKWVIELKYLQQSVAKPPLPEEHGVDKNPTNTNNYEDKIQITTNNPPVIPPRGAAADSEDSDFENLWKSYIPTPGKDGKPCSKDSKAQAKVAYQALRKKHSAEEILTATKRYIEHCHNTIMGYDNKKQFTMHVRTFLGSHTKGLGNEEYFQELLSDSVETLTFKNPNPLIPQDYNQDMTADSVVAVVWSHVNEWWSSNQGITNKISAITNEVRNPTTLNYHQKALQMALELAKEIFRYKDSPEVKNSLVDPLFWLSHKDVITELYVATKMSGLLYVGYQLGRLAMEG